MTDAHGADTVGQDVRPSSSLSCQSSSASRIPRLTRSCSLRVSRTTSAGVGDTTCSALGSTLGEQAPQRESKMADRPAALFRSSSFISSRGMTGLSQSPTFPNSPHPFLSLPHSQPPRYGCHPRTGRPLSFSLTPELPRRRFSYVSPYSRGYIAAERKAKECEVEQNDELDECESVSSLDSCSLGSCMSSCDGVPQALGRSSEGRRSVSGIVHCSHNHDNVPGTYLTPTQRAARTIRALRGRLVAAERQVAARDLEISSLNRQLVELRLSGADTQQTPEKKAAPAQRQPPSQPSLTGLATDRLPVVGGQPKQSTSPADDPIEDELRGLSSSSHRPGAAGSGSPTSVSLADTNDSTEFNRSLADSGHYDDLTSPATSARELPKDKMACQGIPASECDGAKASLHPVTAGSVTDTDKGPDEFGEEEYHSDLDAEDDDDEEVSETDEDVDEEEDEEEDDEDELDDAWRKKIEAQIEERLKTDHERVVERFKQDHLNEFHHLKERHNDKVEALLTKLSDANLRYFELRPQLDRCQARTQQLEGELERAKDDLSESERRHQSTYLQMFLKGQQAARLQHESEGEGTTKDCLKAEEAPPQRGAEGTVAGLLKQLALTQDELRKLKTQKPEPATAAPTDGPDSSRGGIDPAVTLQFLKSAIFYFLTDKDNAKGHLRAIISILGFNEAEKYSIVQIVKF